MYRSFLADAKIVSPHMRVIGLTATPFRMKSGPICTPEGILNHICYEIGIRQLIADGYLCPLRSKPGEWHSFQRIDLASVLPRACNQPISKLLQLGADVQAEIVRADRALPPWEAIRVRVWVRLPQRDESGTG